MKIAMVDDFIWNEKRSTSFSILKIMMNLKKTLDTLTSCWRLKHKIQITPLEKTLPIWVYNCPIISYKYPFYCFSWALYSLLANQDISEEISRLFSFVDKIYMIDILCVQFIHRFCIYIISSATNLHNNIQNFP